jgi:hypothetical protein
LTLRVAQLNAGAAAQGELPCAAMREQVDAEMMVKAEPGLCEFGASAANSTSRVQPPLDGERNDSWPHDKGMHVHTARSGDGCRSKIQSHHERSDRAQHSPFAGAGRRQYRLEKIPAARRSADRKQLEEEVAIPVKCNIHPWMHGWFALVKRTYSTTDENGSYIIKNVPAGSYTVTAWQEEYGTQAQKVTVSAGKPATVDFTFKAK